MAAVDLGSTAAPATLLRFRNQIGGVAGGANSEFEAAFATRFTSVGVLALCVHPPHESSSKCLEFQRLICGLPGDPGRSR